MLNKIIHNKDAEKAIISILSKMHQKGPIDVSDLEQLAYYKRFHKETFVKYEKRLLYLMGLFYKVNSADSIIEEVYSLYADSIEEDTGKRFTPVQADAIKKIYQKVYFSFSAPTSGGKSYLFRELINKTSGDIIIVVPSRALIAEYMHAVINLVDKSVLVLQFIENINKNNIVRRIFIVTPERGVELFKYRDELNVELFLLDEAQISEEKIRGMKFDSFVRRIDKVFPKAKKVFAHPFVNNPEAQLNKHNFNIKESTYAKYNQNSVGKIFLCSDSSGFSYFSPFYEPRKLIPCEENLVNYILKRKGTLLIYIAKSKLYDGRYREEFSKYIDLCPKITNKNAIALVEELRDFIGAKSNSITKKSLMADMMEYGIVIHHGSMPLKARLIVEKFVKSGHARICFATSTLNQGINMPFDAVWIDNFRSMDILTLKNLIGRAGRTTRNQNVFDFGYTIVNKCNVNSFCRRIIGEYNLSNYSKLDVSIDDLSQDLLDIVEAVKNDKFDDRFRLTDTQVKRLKSKEISNDIKFVLDNLMVDNRMITGSEYYKLANSQRDIIKMGFKNIYLKHLRRQNLTSAEASVLSAAIPMLLWHIQGKSFREIVSLRHAFLSEKDKQREIKNRLKKNEISVIQARKELNQLKIRYTPIASSLPNPEASKAGLFERGTPVTKLDYDILIYDTYDYLDKVISLSLADPICAAFQLYAARTGDKRAIAMANYVRYGTNDEEEIWLLRYGFAFEDIAWIKNYVDHIDEYGIIFNDKVKDLESKKREIIGRYL